MSTWMRSSTTNMPPIPAHMPEPPPAAPGLTDVPARVGWVEGSRIGFRGFGDEAEAMHAAWIAHRTLARRLALRAGRRPIPVDTERLELDRSREPERILAGGQSIATLLRPGDASRSGPHSFGFELRVPELADEKAMRATAYVLYRTLRRTGVRWAIWARPRRSEPDVVEQVIPAAGPASPPLARTPTRTPGRLGTGGGASTPVSPPGWTTISLSAALAILMITIVAGPSTTLPAIISILGGAAALLALAALASLGRRLVSNVLEISAAPARPAMVGAERREGVAREGGLPRRHRGDGPSARRGIPRTGGSSHP